MKKPEASKLTLSLIIGSLAFAILTFAAVSANQTKEAAAAPQESSAAPEVKAIIDDRPSVTVQETAEIAAPKVVSSQAEANVQATTQSTPGTEVQQTDAGSSQTARNILLMQR
ncbi:hypothetical protein [Cohnella lupini]|uniref:Uncharacterized protein n=1 Tax=Cohnella lupini TaxID=1294267 RepID=A0A3D9IA49_9BACL|nr:hypothetical protein [Cohnella lupini]RED58638.1 hypothetical protein DFP95_108165 [Cohnella lupini]